MLAVSYLAFVLSDVLMMAIGNIMFDDGSDFVCVDQTEVIPINNSGAMFLLAYSVLILLFSFMMWCVFFKVPDYHGLLYKVRSGNMHVRNEFTDSMIDGLAISEDIKSIINSENDEQMARSPMNINRSNT